MGNEVGDRNKRIAKNTLMLYVRSIIIILVSLYTSRVTLDVLGVSDYGIYNVVSECLPYLHSFHDFFQGLEARL